MDEEVFKACGLVDELDPAWPPAAAVWLDNPELQILGEYLPKDRAVQLGTAYVLIDRLSFQPEAPDWVPRIREMFGPQVADLFAEGIADWEDTVGTFVPESSASYRTILLAVTLAGVREVPQLVAENQIDEKTLRGRMIGSLKKYRVTLRGACPVLEKELGRWFADHPEYVFE